MTRADELREALGPRSLAIADLGEIRADSEPDEIRITGHAAVFDSPSEELSGPGFRFTETIKRGAFKRVLKASPDTRLLINHDDWPVLARTASGTLSMKEDARGLSIDASVAPTQTAEELRVAMTRGDIDKMSFGFTVTDDEWRFEDDGEGGEIVHREIREIGSLFDVSVVTFPAYQGTDAQARAEVRSEFERVLTKEDATPQPPADPPAEELEVDQDAGPDQPVAEAGTDGEAETGDQTGGERSAKLSSAARSLQLAELARRRNSITDNKEQTNV